MAAWTSVREPAPGFLGAKYLVPLSSRSFFEKGARRGWRALWCLTLGRSYSVVLSMRCMGGDEAGVVEGMTDAGRCLQAVVLSRRDVMLLEAYTMSSSSEFT